MLARSTQEGIVVNLPSLWGEDGPPPGPRLTPWPSARSRHPRPDAAALLERARALADELAPGAAEHDRTGTFAQAHVDAVWRAGLGNLTLPAELGGAGADLRTSAAAVRLLAAGDASTALVWSCTSPT